MALLLREDWVTRVPTLTTNVAQLRHQRSMSQQQLADIVGCRRETIGKLEHGRYNPSLKLAMDIAHVFDKNVEEVFQFSDSE